MTGHRPVTMVRLESIKTSEACWFVDHHGAVHISNAAAWRKKHMEQICGFIVERPENDRVIFFGDFNDLPQNSGVRGVAAAHGYRHLRARLPDSKITGEMWNTFKGFRVTKREGEWIDDILSSSAITPLDAAVSLTDPSVYPVAASDHNGVFARMRFGAAV